MSKNMDGNNENGKGFLVKTSCESEFRNDNDIYRQVSNIRRTKFQHLKVNDF